MCVVFMGTPDVAVPALRALLESPHDVAAVVTQPDKPRGRGRGVSASPVKDLAEEHGLPILQPASPKEEGFADALSVFEPNALAVVAYGHILPTSVLSVAPAMNAHFSLLPAYRGAAPVQRALMDGATETGVSVFMLEPTVDTGPVVAVERVEVGPQETAGELLDRLAPIGARLLVGAIDELERGALEPIPQGEIDASPAPKLKPEEAEIDWKRSAGELANLVRALNPRPGAFTTAGGKRLIVWRARAVEGSGPSGTVLSAAPGLVVATGRGGLSLDEVQLEGKRPMPIEEFVRGRRFEAGRPLAGA
ncbi:MAG: methionyl-tRNA formyltransferase [Actinobacteria bacterium]|nr:MAG: methionyl-tRNA formyltransferase [Actinomycetota bacterium]